MSVQPIQAKTTLYLGDLSIYCTVEDLQRMFTQYGPVASIDIKRDQKTKRSLSYGFVKFHMHQDAQNAIMGLNGIMVHGREMRVIWAKDPSQKVEGQKDDDKGVLTVQLHISFISHQTSVLISEHTLRDVYSTFGVVADVAIKQINISKRAYRQSGYGFVHFFQTDEGVASAFTAIRETHRRTIDKITYNCSLSHGLKEQLRKAGIEIPADVAQEPSPQNTFDDAESYRTSPIDSPESQMRAIIQQQQPLILPSQQPLTQSQQQQLMQQQQQQLSPTIHSPTMHISGGDSITVDGSYEDDHGMVGCVGRGSFGSAGGTVGGGGGAGGGMMGGGQQQMSQLFHYPRNPAAHDLSPLNMAAPEASYQPTTHYSSYGATSGASTAIIQQQQLQSAYLVSPPQPQQSQMYYYPQTAGGGTVGGAAGGNSMVPPPPPAMQPRLRHSPRNSDYYNGDSPELHMRGMMTAGNPQQQQPALAAPQNTLASMSSLSSSGETFGAAPQQGVIHNVYSQKYVSPTMSYRRPPQAIPQQPFHHHMHQLSPGQGGGPAHHQLTSVYSAPQQSPSQYSASHLPSPSQTYRMLPGSSAAGGNGGGGGGLAPSPGQPQQGQIPSPYSANTIVPSYGGTAYGNYGYGHIPRGNNNNSFRRNANNHNLRNV